MFTWKWYAGNIQSISRQTRHAPERPPTGAAHFSSREREARTSLMRQARVRRLLRIALFGGLLALLGLLAWGVLRPPTNAASPLEGKPASDFVLETFDGRRVSLSEFRGKPIVLNFFASWCLPCHEEAPILEAAWQQYGPRGVVFIGVAVSDKREDSLAFVRRYGKTYLAGPDADGSISLDYGLFGVPETVFISPEGLIRNKTTGPVTPELLSSRLEPYL
jgi:cytochrome c biogenesis protein CcmG/thiol:disulfide interchange protein DsbE